MLLIQLLLLRTHGANILLYTYKMLGAFNGVMCRDSNMCEIR
jgi:hypothetical protein